MMGISDIYQGGLWRAVRKISLVLVVSVVLSLSTAVPAGAAETADWLPFDIDTGIVEVGCTWNNGCEAGYHNGTLAPAIDFIAPSGTPVYAAGSGTVVGSYSGCDPDNSPGCSGSRGNYVEISHADGRHSRYLHLSSVAVSSGSVARGDLIGHVGNSGGSPVAHLHYDETINGTKVDPGIMYARHGNANVQYPTVLGYATWPEVPSWSDYFVSNDSFAANVASPHFVARTGTSIHGKKGALTSAWVWAFNATPVSNVRVAGERITYVSTTGELWAKDGIEGQWFNFGVVDQYAASPSLLVVRIGNQLHVKSGALHSGWVWGFGATPAVDVRVSGNRITYTDTNGELWAKDGYMGQWFNFGAVSQYAASDSTLVLRSGTSLHAKTGLLTDPTPWQWAFNSANAVDVRVSGSRIAYTSTAGDLWIRDSINNPWVNIGHVDQYALSPDVLVVRGGTGLHAKTGLITDTSPGWYWSFNNEGATDVRVSGTRIAYTSTNGKLWMRDSVSNPWIDFGTVDEYAF